MNGVNDGNDTTGTVAAVFANVLGATEIDHEAGFFELGATSLTVVRAMNQLRERWPFLGPVDAFAHPTVTALARYIETRTGA